MDRRAGLAGAVAVMTAWAVLVVAAPAWSSAAAGTPAALGPAAVRAIGALVCHQRAERSLAYAGLPLPVCARCTGLYVGGAIGGLLWVALSGLGRRPRPLASRLADAPLARTALIVWALPTIVTVATAWLGLWDPTNFLRALFAVPLGSVIGAVVTAVAARDLR